MPYILALDQGTTSSRSILFGRDGREVASAQQEFSQILPSSGHVEHDPEAIWQSQLATARRVLEQAKIAADDIAAIGITNQRETTVLWEKATGKPVANAIVWQSRISAPICERLKAAGHEPSGPRLAGGGGRRARSRCFASGRACCSIRIFPGRRSRICSKTRRG